MSPPPADARPLPDDAVLLQRIIGFIAEALDRSPEDIDPDIDLYERLGLDSLGATCVFIDISYEFGIPEPGEKEDFVVLDTARKILGYVRRQEAWLD